MSKTNWPEQVHTQYLAVLDERDRALEAMRFFLDVATIRWSESGAPGNLHDWLGLTEEEALDLVENEDRLLRKLYKRLVEDV